MIGQNKTIKNFWMIFFGTVAVLAIAAAALLYGLMSQKIATMRMSQVSDDNVYKLSQENGYRSALYSACDSVKNIDADLGKVAVSQDNAHQIKLLTDVVIHANAANTSISQLPFAESDNLAACQRFVNQTQDYASYLIGKLSKQQPLSADERSALRRLDNVAQSLYDFLQQYSQSDSGMFIVNGNGIGNVGALSDAMDGLQNDVFTYEKLIYDGPFSESVQQKTLPSDNALPPEHVAKQLQTLFGKAQFEGEIRNQGTMYAFALPEGRLLTDVSGRVVQYEVYNPDATGNADSQRCIAAAEEMCAKLGYDVKGVWTSKTQDAVTYVNCAPVIDGVIVYPDLIKVAVGCDGSVVGLEARAYLLNHCDWDVTFGDVSQQDALSALDGGLAVTNVAKALIQKDNQFLTCYEFEAALGERQYYVYVDSRTGQEVELFKVVQNTEGHTVM